MHYTRYKPLGTNGRLHVQSDCLAATQLASERHTTLNCRANSVLAPARPPARAPAELSKVLAAVSGRV